MLPRWRAAAWLLSGVLTLGVSGCKKDSIEWSRFNADGDFLIVGVGASEPVVQEARCTDEPSLCEGDDGCICLNSSLRANDVGYATVDPTNGPVGTRHTVRIEVLDAFQDIVQRVTVYTIGQRGDEEIELHQDSADAGSWAIELESLGEPDESRVDTFEVRLYEPGGSFSADEATDASSQ
jgi:hypothetical protein